MKNNEAAKRSRDMRIKREKVVFEENSRLEQDNREMRTELVSWQIRYIKATIGRFCHFKDSKQKKPVHNKKSKASLILI